MSERGARPRLQALDGLAQAAHERNALGGRAAVGRHAPLEQRGQVLGARVRLGGHGPERALQSGCKTNMSFAEPRPGEAARAPGTPALAAASRGARSRTLRALATVKHVNPVHSHRPEGAWHGTSLRGRALDTRASTHLNTYVSGAWSGSTKAWLLLLQLPSSRCCPPHCVSCAPGPQACTQARPCKRAGLPGCHA